MGGIAPTVGGRAGFAVRGDKRLAAQGLVSETADPGLYGTAVAPTSQTVYGALIGLAQGDVATGLILRLAVAASGTAPTEARVGLADSSGNIVVLSGSVKAATSWVAGASNFAFTAPYTVPADGGYYACFVVNGTWSFTQPTIMRGAATAAAMTAYGSHAPPGFSWASQTDLPAVGAALTLTSGPAVSYYMAVY